MRFVSPALWVLLSVAPLAAQDDMTDAELVLAISARGESDAGGTPLMGVESGSLRAGQRRRFRLAVPAGTCVLIAAEARGVRKVSVALTARGRTLARAEGAQVAQTVHCHEGGALQARLEVRAEGGRGVFAAGAYRVTAEAAAPSGATAQEVLERLEGRHAGTGYVPASPAANEQLVDGGGVERRVSLVGGSCYRVLAGGGRGVTDVALRLAPASGASQTTCQPSPRTLPSDRRQADDCSRR